MAAWGYEFCLLVLKVSLTSDLKITFVSPRGHVISSIHVHVHCNTSCYYS